MTPKTVEAILFELREKVATGLTVRESGHPETWPKTSFGRDLMDAFDEIRARLARDRGHSGRFTGSYICYWRTRHGLMGAGICWSQSK